MHRPSRPSLVLSCCVSVYCAWAGLAPLATVATARKEPPVDRATLMVQRFTFGPRPGEIARVRSMGVDAWFEQQLDPDRIDDSALEQRLNMYPALRLSQEERLARYPTPATVRQIARTGNLPADPVARAIVSDQVEFYEMRQQAKGAKSPVSGSSSPVAGSAGTASEGMAASNPAQAVPAQNLEQRTPPLPQSQVDAILKLAPQDRYKYLLHAAPDQLIALRKGLRGNEGRLAEGLTAEQRETLAALAGTNRMVSGELFGSRLLRDIYSQRELEAVMTDFWLNHFNVYIRKDGQMPSLLPEYEETVRRHALGRFEDLLEATAKSPAMLMYLDNAQSTGPDSPAALRGVAAGRPKQQKAGLNENYARELMELHTLGVNGGYTQTDVTEVAKVFTGWTMERPAEGGDFVFNERRHEPGPKHVLGRTIKESGESEGEEVLHMLSTSPATAHFISLELAQRFVSDTPPPAIVDRMAQTFLRTSGDIRQVLRTMVHSPEFATPATVHAKIKTPLEYVVSAVRATNADVQNPLPLAQSLERLGMPLYGCQPPTGYKWDAETWLSSAALINRMNFALLFGSNRIPGTSLDTSRLIAGSNFLSGGGGSGAPAEQKEQALEAALLDAPASSQTRIAVLSQTDDSAMQRAARDFNPGATNMGGEDRKTKGMKQLVNMNSRTLGSTPAKPNPEPADKTAATMTGLLIGSPEFQRR